MYNPAHFRETRPEMLEAIITAHPLAALVTLGTNGLEATHLPLVYYRQENGPGVLRGHIARPNPQWRQYTPEIEALAIFSGPQHYVSPAWYPSREEDGRVVPTWNYVAVHGRGKLSVHHEPEWLLENVRALTDSQEKGIENPWRVAEAPPDFIENLLRAIVGIELKLTTLEGKWKVSQNRTMPEREGVIGGLEGLGTPESRRMAELVRMAIRQSNGC